MLEYIQEKLTVELHSGQLSIVDESDSFFAVLGGRFPIGFHRIAWEQVGEKKRIEVLEEPRQISSDELQQMLTEHKAVVKEWFDEAGIGPEAHVVWVGDNTDVALEMTARALLEFFPVLFSFPQHSYALPKDGAWCLNYVMEGELFFAEAVKK